VCDGLLGQRLPRRVHQRRPVHGRRARP
jgi:hypothetical protein